MLEWLHRFQHSVQGRAEVVLDFVFPDAQHEPARLCQGFVYLAVALDVALNFGNPVVAVGLDGGLFFSPIVAVPEVTVDKNGDAPAEKNNVRPPGQYFVVATVSQPGVPEGFAESDFGLGVGSAYFPHDLRHPLGGVKPGSLLKAWHFDLVGWLVGCHVAVLFPMVMEPWKGFGTRPKFRGYRVITKVWLLTSPDAVAARSTYSPCGNP